MDSKKKLQLSVIVGVAMLLVLLLIVGIILIPLTATTPPVSSGGETVTDTTPVEVQKYDITGRLFDKNGKPMANVKCSISLGPTDFTTDENGFFILKNLPVGTYTISMYDEDGNRIGSTELILSSDGTVSINYYTFEKGAVVTLGFDGEKFYPVEVKEATNSGNKNDSDKSDSSTSSNDKTDGNTNNQDSEDEIIATPVEPDEEDETYTNLSWMKDEPFGYGGYSLTPFRMPEEFNEMVRDDQYDMFNTYFLSGNLEYCKYQAKILKEEDKQMWLSVLETPLLTAVNSSNPKDRLVGNWRQIIDEYMYEIYSIAGTNFCGFYFDEPNLYITEMDFIRVTEYMRKTYNRRVFVVHNGPAYLTPSSKGFDLIGYKPGRGDGLIVSEKNHKWVTDVAYWRYASLRRYGGMKNGTAQWTKVVSMLNKDARIWFVPPIGTYDWKTLEKETAEMILEMYKYHAQFDNFGGVMLYSMSYGPLSGGPSFVTEGSSQGLTEDDYLKDENGDYVFQTSDGRHVKKDAEGKYSYTITETIDGEKVIYDFYMKLGKDVHTRNYFYDNHDGEDTPFESDKADKYKLSRVVSFKVNYSPINLVGTNAYAEGGGYFFNFEQLPDGSYRWPIVREYIYIIGEGLQSVFKGEKTHEQVISEMEAVYTPDRSLYLQSNRWWEN